MAAPYRPACDTEEEGEEGEEGEERIFQAGRNRTVTQTIVLKPETRGTLDLDLEDPLVQAARPRLSLLGTTHECKNVRT